jgi:hypothetical protein
METSPHKKISGSLKKLCIYLVLAFAALACSDGALSAPTPTNQPQQTSQTTSADQPTPASSLSTDCDPSSPCFGGGSDNNTTQHNTSALQPNTPPCSTHDLKQPFCVYLDYRQLTLNQSVTLGWQLSDSYSSSSYQSYSTIQLAFPSGNITKQTTSVSGGNTSLSQTLSIGKNELDVLQIEGCVNTNCYDASEPIVINTGYAYKALSNVQTQHMVMLHASARNNLLSPSLILEKSAICPNFCKTGETQYGSTYYISRSTVTTISRILKGYNQAKDFIDVLKIVLPKLVASLECTACGIAATVLSVIATIIGFYIAPLQQALNNNRNSQGVTFQVQYGIFLQKSSIRAV